ncbi:MAG: hypothetical protein HEQ20_11355 [Aphanizomenon flos-aquae KM1D3_PB]|nr:MAG: hypothetical protein HEQ20_11355 [Aphanizomenon flos-aquae KM1D3_PB]
MIVIAFGMLGVRSLVGDVGMRSLLGMWGVRSLVGNVGRVIAVWGCVGVR